MIKIKIKTFKKIVFWIYVILIILIVAIKFNGTFEEIIHRIDRFKYLQKTENWMNYNLIPLKSIKMQLKYMNQTWAALNILANIILFIPYGFLLPFTYKKCRSFIKSISIIFFSILIIELFQLVTMLGSFDVDDIILNVFGASVGYILYKFYYFLRLKIKLI